MTDNGSQTQPTRRIHVDNLLLDSENPRLPERLRGGSQSSIMTFLRENGVLEEIAQSYLDNGYFQHEPLIVVKKQEEEKYVVVEGNRRLAALKILHGSPEADNLELLGIDPSPTQLERLREIPCFLTSDRGQIHSYIGFRHIGGLKTWQPEAKARYLLAEVRQLIRNDVNNPFRELGRRVGSNAQGVRTPYLAIRILLHAREEFGLDVAYVQERRFGVWLRCMNSADIRKYIGLSQARTYSEIEEAVGAIDQDRLAEVLRDLGSEGKESRPVLGDSRDVTDYGRALTHERAYSVLRSTADLSFAKQVIEELDLVPRVQRLVKGTVLFLDTLHRAETAEISNSLLQTIEELSRLARSARAIVKDRMDDSDNVP